jgi:hypothetical protein
MLHTSAGGPRVSPGPFDTVPTPMRAPGGGRGQIRARTRLPHGQERMHRGCMSRGQARTMHSAERLHHLHAGVPPRRQSGQQFARLCPPAGPAISGSEPGDRCAFTFSRIYAPPTVRHRWQGTAGSAYTGRHAIIQLAGVAPLYAVLVLPVVRPLSLPFCRPDA